MKRLQFLDAALLLVLGSLWLGCFCSAPRRSRPGTAGARARLCISANGVDGYPTVRGFRPGADLENENLAVGDTIVKLGNSDLRGIGPLGFVARAYEQVAANLQVPISFLHQGNLYEGTFKLKPATLSSGYTALWSTLPLTLGFVIPAVFVLLREPGSRQVRAFFLASMAYGFQWVLFPGGSHLQTYAWMVVFFCSSSFMFPLILHAALLFPEHIAPTGVRLPFWPWLFAIFGLIQMNTMFGFPSLPPALGLRANAAVTGVFILGLLSILTWDFRSTNAIGRRQLKWVMYGFYIGTVPMLAVNVITTFEPSLWWLHHLALLAVALIPCLLALPLSAMISSISTVSSVRQRHTLYCWSFQLQDHCF